MNPPQKFNYKKIGVVLIAVALCYFSLCYILTQPVNIENTTAVNGHFKSIEEVTAKGDKSYNLYLQESENCYRIVADNSACFYSRAFFNEIKPGQLIRLYVNKPVPFFHIGGPKAVSIVANKVQYLYFDCVNDDIETSKIKLPMFAVVLFLLSVAVIYKKELKGRLNKLRT